MAAAPWVTLGEGCHFPQWVSLLHHLRAVGLNASRDGGLSTYQGTCAHQTGPGSMAVLSDVDLDPTPVTSGYFVFCSQTEAIKFLRQSMVLNSSVHVRRWLHEAKSPSSLLSGG